MYSNETITNNSFDVYFQFEDLSIAEIDILCDTFISLKDNEVKFELRVLDKKVQPLDILIRLKSTNSVGECQIKMKNRESALVDLNIKEFKVTEIVGLLDFNVQDDNDKYVKIIFESGSVVYKTKDVEETV